MARGDRSGELLPWPPIADTLSPTVTLNPTMTRSHDMSERHDRLMKILTEQQTTSLSKDNEAGNATLTEAQAPAARDKRHLGRAAARPSPRSCPGPAQPDTRRSQGCRRGTPVVVRAPAPT